MEIVARILLFLITNCLLLIAAFTFLAWNAALVRQNYVGLKERFVSDSVLTHASLRHDSLLRSRFPPVYSAHHSH